LLFRRFLGRGKGVVVRGAPSLGKAYIRKLDELNPDIVFVLDKPLIDKEFFDALKERDLPLVWVDHHPAQSDFSFKEYDVTYFNPLQGKKKSSEPVSYWCYRVVERDKWIAMLGCVADWHIPEFAQEFADRYEDIYKYSDDVGKVLYETEFGKLVRTLDFALKDSTTNVVKMLKYLAKVRSPYELLNRESAEAEFIYSRFERINKRYERLIERARESVGEKVLFFSYSGQFSLSANVSNELYYLFPDKLIVVAYVNEGKVNVSLRGGGVDLRLLEKDLMKGIEGTYGGHEKACGASFSSEDFERFKENLNFLRSKKV